MSGALRDGAVWSGAVSDRQQAWTLLVEKGIGQGGGEPRLVSSQGSLSLG